MMPMIATTIKSSISEKPFWFFFCISFVAPYGEVCGGESFAPSVAVIRATRRCLRAEEVTSPVPRGAPRAVAPKAGVFIKKRARRESARPPRARG
jgi:hypothetical protein